MLAGAPENEVGMAHQVLVQRVVPGDQHAQGIVFAAPAAPGLLPRAGDAAGVARERGRVQPADVYAQFQRVRRHHAQQVALQHALLDGAALLREIRSSVGADAGGEGRVVGAEAVARRHKHEFRLPARPNEDKRPRSAPHQRLQQRRGDAWRGRPRPLAVDHGRIPKDEPLFAMRRAVLVHHLGGPAGQPLREFARVGDGGRAEDERGVAPVALAEAAQAAQHVRNVRPEHAPVDVHFVHDDVAERAQRPRPVRMAGQHADVQHIRVREHRPRRPPNRAPLSPRRVAVEYPDLGREFRGEEPAQSAQLILREGFRREEVERAGGGVGQHRLRDGNVVAEALAARGGRDEGDVAPAQRGFDCARLVGVERQQPALGERGFDARVKPFRSVPVGRRSGGDFLDVREFPAQSADAEVLDEPRGVHVSPDPRRRGDARRPRQPDPRRRRIARRPRQPRSAASTERSTLTSSASDGCASAKAAALSSISAAWE